MSDKAQEHAPDAPMPARPGDAERDLAGGPGDTPSRPDGAVVSERSERRDTAQGDGAVVSERSERRDTAQGDGAVEDEEEAEEGPLGDIAAEVAERVEAGEGRDDRPDLGSEGALGKPETGEW